MILIKTKSLLALNDGMQQFGAGMIAAHMPCIHDVICVTNPDVFLLQATT